MLKTRIIGVLVIRQGIVVQSIQFKKYLPVGKPSIAVDFLNRWGIDEIILLDIDATREQRRPNFDQISELSDFCHVPLSVGGGIRSVEDIQQLIHSGADKVVLNTVALEEPELIVQGAELFGNQCIVVSMDVKEVSTGRYEIYKNSGKDATGVRPAEFAKKVEEYGAGEIFLNAIDRDGSKQGYNIDLMQQVMDAVSIPVIICGGANHPDHFKEAMSLKVSAVAAANYFHYTEHSPIALKSYLKSSAADVRLDSYATYDGYNFGYKGRIGKKDDAILDKLRFEYIPEEII